MSKILLKILDKVIFPAATLVVTKVFGLYLSTQIFHLNWYVKNYTTAGDIFSVRFVFESPEAALLANTFSNILMFIAVVLICGLILIRAYHLHTTHQNPRVIARLAKINLLGLISNTEDILTDAFVWFTALWIAAIVCIYTALNGNAYLWIAPVTFTLSLIASAMLITDLDKEFDYRAQKRVN